MSTAIPYTAPSYKLPDWMSQDLFDDLRLELSLYDSDWGDSREKAMQMVKMIDDYLKNKEG